MAQKFKYLTWLLVSAYLFCLGCSDNKYEMPSWVKEYITEIDYQQIDDKTPEVSYSVVSENIVKVSVSIDLKDSVWQNDWQVNFTPAFLPDFHWTPHLTPTDEHIVAQHAFRAPAIIVSSDERKLTVIPDLDLLQENPSVDWYMNMDALNADGEWNDSRQSLFSELIIRYGEELKREEYVQRGLAALYASFEMMYCPENSATKEQWEKVWPFFNEKDYGFMMENYGHGGVTSPDGIGIGEFTIYEWGNGAASEAYNRIVDHWGKDYINVN